VEHAAVTELQRAGHQIPEEDIARPPELSWGYVFTASQPGEGLRPLRDVVEDEVDEV
jgi:hypothetical protein